MYRPPVPLVDLPQGLEPHQRLALNVLRQALADARSHPHRDARRLARGWLLSTTNKECLLWCHIAGVKYQLFVDECRRVLDAR
jgi:hypothetical protein